MDLKPGDHHYKAFVGPHLQYDFMGATQFRLLTTLGLRAGHTLLDVGCGSLRAGRLFIPYLDPENYHGLEPNKWLIEDAVKNELGKDILRLKKPSFDHNSEFDCSVFGKKFDYIVAQSIFSHTGNALLKKALKNIKKALNENGMFLATFIHGPDHSSPEEWIYPECVTYSQEYLLESFKEIGFYGQELPWYHPRQRWYILVQSPSLLPDGAIRALLHGLVFYSSDLYLK